MASHNCSIHKITKVQELYRIFFPCSANIMGKCPRNTEMSLEMTPNQRSLYLHSPHNNDRGPPKKRPFVGGQPSGSRNSGAGACSEAVKRPGWFSPPIYRMGSRPNSPKPTEAKPDAVVDREKPPESFRKCKNRLPAWKRWRSPEENNKYQFWHRQIWFMWIELNILLVYRVPLVLVSKAEGVESPKP